MASLADTITNNMKLVRQADGTLAYVPTPTNELSDQAGLSSSPTTPIGMSMIGGTTAKQQDMAGSTNQLRSAQTQALEPANQLSTAIRQRTNTRPATSSEEAYRKQSEALQGLSTVPGRVQSLIQSKLSNLSMDNQLQVSPDADIQAMAVPGTKVDYSGLKASLTKLQANPQDMVALSQVNTSLGRNPTTILTPEEISRLYKSSVDTIASGVGGNLPRDITVGDLVSVPGFSYTTKQLSEILGIPEAEVGAMNMEALQDVISEQIKRPYAATQTQASSPLLGQAERGAYKQVGQELSTTGVTATEAAMNRLQQSVQQGNLVEFNGKTYTVQELLGDHGVTEAVTNYLQAPEGSETRLELEKSEPELVNFIKSHYDALEGLRSTLGESASQLKSIQDTEATQAQVGNVRLSDDIMKAVDVNWGKIVPVATSSKLVETLRGMGNTKGQVAATTLNSIAQAHPDLVSELPSLSADQIKSLANPVVLTELDRNRDTINKLTRVESTGNIDEALQLITGNSTINASAIQALLDEDKARKAIGLPTSGISKYVDIDGDGHVDPAESIIQQVKASTRANSLSDVTSGIDNTWKPPSDILNSPMLSPDQQRVRTQLGQYINDGTFTAQELVQAGLGQEDLKLLDSMGILNQIRSSAPLGESSTTKALVDSAIRAPIIAKTNQVLKTYEVPPADILIKGKHSIEAMQSQFDTAQANLLGLSALRKSIVATGDADQYDLKAIDNQISALQSSRDKLRKWLSDHPAPVKPIPPIPEPAKSKPMDQQIESMIKEAKGKIGSVKGGILSPAIGIPTSIGTAIESKIEGPLKKWMGK